MIYSETKPSNIRIDTLSINSSHINNLNSKTSAFTPISIIIQIKKVPSNHQTRNKLKKQ